MNIENTEMVDNAQESADQGAGGQEQDLFKNLKSEFNRKQENTNQQLAALADQLSNLNNMIRANVQPQQPARPVNTKAPDPLTEPEAYTEYMAARTDAIVSSKLATEQRKQSELTNLAINYPELHDANSDLTKAAIKAFSSLPEEERISPMAYRLAVQSAAADLGILPSNKRGNSKSNNDDNSSTGEPPFMSNSQGGKGNTGNNNNRKPKDIDPKTLEFARLLGRDVSDPKVLEGLKKSSSRKNWSKYRKQGEE